MRHGDKINNLSRTSEHRKALMSNMAISLIKNKRIFTTVAKAKALRKYVEPILTRAKSDTTHSRRMSFADLKNKEAVIILYKDIATKIAARPGGYTRIIKTGPRPGDNADMAMIELVDFNELLTTGGVKETATKKKATRRSRKTADDAEVITSAEKKPRAKKAAPKADDSAAE